MSRLSDERIDEIMLNLSMHPYEIGSRPKGARELARAIEREVAIYWQERMRERAAVASWMHYADVCVRQNISPHDAHYGRFIAAKEIRNLEIEEVKP